MYWGSASGSVWVIELRDMRYCSFSSVPGIRNECSSVSTPVACRWRDVGVTVDVLCILDFDRALQYYYLSLSSCFLKVVWVWSVDFLRVSVLRVLARKNLAWQSRRTLLLSLGFPVLAGVLFSNRFLCAFSQSLNVICTRIRGVKASSKGYH